MKKILILITFLIFVFMPFTTNARTLEDYNYSYFGKTIGATPAYSLSYEINSEVLDQELSDLIDVEVYEDKIYLLDKTLNKLIITDKEWNVLHTVEELDGYIPESLDDNRNKLKGPTSVNVTNEYIYIADKDNGRIVILNTDTLKFVKHLEKPNAPGIENIEFKPIKVIVDKTQRIYIIAQDVYEGIIEIDINGVFKQYTGVNKVKYNMIDLFWRSISSEEQKAKMPLYIPVTFTNFDIDDRGFIYTVSGGDDSESIKRLNLKGENTLRTDGRIPPVGDIYYELSGDGKIGPSTFTSISVNDYGVYLALDGKRGRIFSYDDSGELLYIIGQLGDKENQFDYPVDVAWMDEDILVVDNNKNRVSVFKTTEFGFNVNQATKLYYNGKTAESLTYWEEALRLNSNYDLAYVGIGKVLYYEQEYKEACDYFKLGNNKYYYSKAFKYYRSEVLKDNFILISFIGIGIVGLLFYRLRKE